MKAVLLEEHGGADRLKLEEVPDLSPGPREAVVRVKACGLNHLDLFVREGKLPIPIPLPHILGSEMAGEVLAVGPEVEGFAEGDRVAVLSRIGCGSCEFCKTGKANICLDSHSLGIDLPGGYAEQVAVPASNLLPLPEGVSYVDAGGASLSALTAWHMLVGRAKIRPGEVVLILAAGSGIGSAAVQIAKALGAEVIATAGGEEKSAKAKALGADEVIDHRAKDIAKEARRLTDRRGVDVVFEHIGADTFGKSLEALSRNGRLVICGAHTGSRVEIDLWRLFAKQISIIGSYYGTREELQEVLMMMALGQLRTVVHKTYPLSGAAEAQRLMEARGQFGKLILTPN